MARSTQMTPRERVQAALVGADVDRPPVSLWQHFPERDQSAAALGESTRWWQGLLDLDFIKLMPPGDYGFSARFAWVNDRFGVSWQLNLGLSLPRPS